jgi:hypothetical protein
VTSVVTSSAELQELRAARVQERSDAVVGAAAVLAGGAVAAGRLLVRVSAPGVRLALEPPLVPHAVRPGRLVEAATRRGRAERLAARQAVEQAVAVLIPAVVARLTQLVPIGDLIKQSVDIDALVADVDIDAIAARIDIEGIIGRIDLGALAEEVIAAVDLPEIIRQSTGAMTSEGVRGARMQGIEADRAVERLVDRLRGRRRAKPDVAASTAEPQQLPTQEPQ